jgi:prepilin-type N-terminal cleavage/methylation domain-containing protein
MNKIIENKYFIFPGNKGFTLVELLLVMVIIGILGGVIFVSVGNQRQKAKLNAVMQTAKGSHAISRECYFRISTINIPNDSKNPNNEICPGSKTEWMPITVDECVYTTSGIPADEYYEIICGDLGKKIQCGIRSDGECQELDYL